MGVRLLELADDRVLAELQLRPEFCTTRGILHGGAVNAFADALGAVDSYLGLAPGQRTTTTDSSA
jgi:1,4-dihydroxy-2-naphthoyl-CoA hydrolase